MLTQQTCNQTYCESAAHLSNVRIAVNRSVVGQTTSSTSEEVAELWLESIFFVRPLSHLSTVLRSDYPFCVARKGGVLGMNLADATS